MHSGHADTLGRHSAVTQWRYLRGRGESKDREHHSSDSLYKITLGPRLYH